MKQNCVKIINGEMYHVSVISRYMEICWYEWGCFFVNKTTNKAKLLFDIAFYLYNQQVDT